MELDRSIYRHETVVTNNMTKVPINNTAGIIFFLLIASSSFWLIDIFWITLDETPSSFSREGACFWITKIIPCSLKQQAFVKALFSTSISIMGIIINCLIFKVYFNYGYIQIGVISFVGILFAALWKEWSSLSKNLFPLWKNCLKPLHQGVLLTYTENSKSWN